MSRLFEATDRPCNSLALNCLQMSCCMPMPAPDGSLDVFEAATDDDNSLEDGRGTPIVGGVSASWMEHLSKLSPETRYRDLLLVGTHDAASYTIPSSQPFSAIARCQNLSAVQQLEAGVRLLDLRVGGQRGTRGHAKVNVWHGSLEGAPFLPILQEIDSFVTDHPKEVVVLLLVPEYGVPFSSDQRLFVLKRTQEIFGNRLVKKSEMKEMLERWTLSDFHEQGKQVIVLFHPRFCKRFKMPAVDPSSGETREWTEEELEAEFDVVNSEVWMRNLWFNTRDTADLLRFVLRDIRQHGNKKRHHLQCSQLVLTPGVGSVGDVFKALAGTNPLRPISLSQHLYKDQILNEYLRTHASEPWNMFLLDYVDTCPWTVRYLTALNFEVPVKVCIAVFSKNGKVVDVAEKMDRFIVRDRAIFLTNVLQDLGLTADSATNNEGGSLVIVYQIANKTYYALTVQSVTPSTSLLISYYATSAESVVTIPWNEQGILNGGQLYSSRAPVRKLEGITIRFKSSASKCVFDLVE